MIVTALATRLRVHDYLTRRPRVAHAPDRAPGICVRHTAHGNDITGQHQSSRGRSCAPLAPVVGDPTSPCRQVNAASLYSDTRAVRRLEAERAMLAANPEIGRYYRFSAIYPNECLFFMGHDFKNVNWESRGRLPAYRDYLFNGVDMLPAYQYHKRFLQLLQADAPGNWNLKMPSHALYLRTLLQVYPDARLIWTHRDPFTATGSFCSLITTGHCSFMGVIDREWIGAEHALAGRAARRAHHATFVTRWENHASSMCNYVDLMREPIRDDAKAVCRAGRSFHT